MKRHARPDYYLQSAPDRPRFPPLHGSRTCDVVIVGGGFTGLSAALQLARTGADAVLLERTRVGAGASGLNGGQIHSGHRKSQVELERWLGRQHARDLWDIAEAGKFRLRDLVTKHSIACDLKNGLVIAAHDPRALRELLADAEYMSREYAFHLQALSPDKIAQLLGSGRYSGGTLDLSGGHFHPLKFAHGLASLASEAGASLHENSPVCAVQEKRDAVVVETTHGHVKAKRAMLACDAFSAELAPKLSPFIAQIESFIVATEPLGKLYASIVPSDAAVADTRHVLDYYRKSADRRLLFAGRESYFRPPRDVAQLVRPRMLKVFPSLADTGIEYAWSGTVGITSTRMPHFGRLGSRVLFGHGYSGHGIALSVIGGRVLADAAVGSSEEFETMARVPAVPFPGGARFRKPVIGAALLWYKMLDAL